MTIIRDFIYLGQGLSVYRGWEGGTVFPYYFVFPWLTLNSDILMWFMGS